MVAGEDRRYSIDINYDDENEKIKEIHVSPNEKGETLCIELSEIDDIPSYMLDETFDITGYENLSENVDRGLFSTLKKYYIDNIQHRQRWDLFNEFGKGYNISTTQFTELYNKYLKGIPTLEGKREFMNKHFKIEEIKKPSFFVETKISYKE